MLRKTVLYPQKSGKLEIEPLSLDITVDVPTKRRNIFGERLMTQAHKTISAGSRSINVKGLPEQGKPANFTGAVGDFDFKVPTTKKELNASESLQANVVVSGKGNLKLFELPKLSLPSSLEVILLEIHPFMPTMQRIEDHLGGLIIKTFTALDEPLFLHLGGERIAELMKRMGAKENEAIEHAMINKSINRMLQKLNEDITHEKEVNSSSADWFKVNVPNTGA